jgi:hypothetical protein
MLPMRDETLLQHNGSSQQCNKYEMLFTITLFHYNAAFIEPRAVYGSVRHSV